MLAANDNFEHAKNAKYSQTELAKLEKSVFWVNMLEKYGIQVK